MTKEQEAQQAQTKSVHGWLLDMQDYLLPIRLKESIDTGFGKEFGEYLIERCRRAESIVDSQSQKIAEQTKEIERLTLMCKQEDAQIIALIKERDEARAEAEQHRDARLIVSDIEPHEVDEEALISNHRYEFPLPWETTDSKEVAR